jgi:hypothetical protein
VATFRARWRAGGDEIMASWDCKGEGASWWPWAFWRFEIGLRTVNRIRCETEAEAILELELCSDEERRIILEEGLIEQQLAQIRAGKYVEV